MAYCRCSSYECSVQHLADRLFLDINLGLAHRTTDDFGPLNHFLADDDFLVRRGVLLDNRLFMPLDDLDLAFLRHSRVANPRNRAMLDFDPLVAHHNRRIG